VVAAQPFGMRTRKSAASSTGNLRFGDAYRRLSEGEKLRGDLSVEFPASEGGLRVLPDATTRTFGVTFRCEQSCS